MGGVSSVTGWGGGGVVASVKRGVFIDGTYTYIYIAVKICIRYIFIVKYAEAMKTVLHDCISSYV